MESKTGTYHSLKVFRDLPAMMDAVYQSLCFFNEKLTRHLRVCALAGAVAASDTMHLLEEFPV